MNIPFKARTELHYYLKRTDIRFKVHFEIDERTAIDILYQENGQKYLLYVLGTMTIPSVYSMGIHAGRAYSCEVTSVAFIKTCSKSSNATAVW